MASRGFYQTNGAFGPVARQNQTLGRFTRPLNPGAYMALLGAQRPGLASDQPTTATIAGVEHKACCSECAREGRNG